VKTHVYQVLPKHLERHFSVPEVGTSVRGPETKSLNLQEAAGNEEIQQMTMTEVASELLVLRVKYTNLLSQQPAEDTKNTSMQDN